jgi:phage terminase small subunit
MPKSLTGDAADFWQRNAPICKQMGTLTSADRDSFTLLCITWQRLQALDASGEAKPIEFVMLSKVFQNLAKPFGLDPLSRKRLGIEQTESTDDDDLLTVK